jgi:hypothetical protein
MLVGEILEKTAEGIQKVHTTEIGLILQNSLWGIWLLLPASTMSGPGYAVLRQVAPEIVWGSISFVLGIGIMFSRLFRLSGLATGFLFASFVWWTIVAISFGMLNVTSTAVPTYAALAVMAAMSYLKSAARSV